MKLLSLFILILAYSSFYSQTNVQGKFCRSIGAGYSSECIEFKENAYFLYSTHGCLGVEDKGKGHYILREKKIILNFDKVQTEQRSEFNSTKVIDTKNRDSVNLNIKVLDGMNNNIPLPATILSESDFYEYKKGFKVDELGEVTILKPMNLNKEKYRILFIGYEQFEFELSNSSSKNVEIILQPAGPHIISNTTKEIEYDQFKENLIELKDGTVFKKIDL
jgi:hypothetical protein